MKPHIDQKIHDAVNALSNVCDGAMSVDGHGFNGGDSSFGKSLAATPLDRWSLKMGECAYKMLRKYKKQLLSHGINYDSIPAPVMANTPEAAPVDLDKVIAGLQFGEWRTVMEGTRMVRNAPATEAWFDAYRANKDLLKSRGFSMTKYEDVWQVAEWRKVNPVVEAPKQATAVNVVKMHADLEAKLLKHQIAPALILAAAIAKHGGAVDASDLGSGKTYVALAVCKLLGLSPFVVCPKAVCTSWRRAANHIGIEVQAVINYEMIRRGVAPWSKWITTKTPRGKEIEQIKWSVAPNTLMIFDEAQKMKNYKSQNCELGIAALRQGIKCLGVSGTIASNPMDMRFVGQVCKLHDGKRFFGWMLANGVQQGRFGLEFRGGQNALSQIHKRIFPEHGVRVRIADIPDFPESQITAESLDCNGNGSKISEVYEEMYKEIAKINANEKLSAGARQGHILAVMMFARQKAEMLKVPMVCDMVEDYLENDHSVVVFTNFVQTLDVLCEKLNTKCFVDGRQSEKERQQCVDDFQSNKSNVIIVNIQSGGAGLSLHDLHGRARASIIFPTWSAQDLKQATGRIHRAGGKSKSIQTIVYASGTIEDRVCERVREKLKNISALNDGDLEPENLFKHTKEK